MGEHIKNLNSFVLKNKQITMELNRMDLMNSEYDIHIEMPPFRYNMTDREFMQFAAIVAEAKRKLDYKQKK